MRTVSSNDEAVAPWRGAGGANRAELQSCGCRARLGQGSTGTRIRPSSATSGSATCWPTGRVMADRTAYRAAGWPPPPTTLRSCSTITSAIMNDPAWQRISRATTAEALRQGAEGWTDESMALHRPWDFDPERIQSTVTWWHGDNDMNAPLSAAKRAAARLKSVDLRVWHNEGHFASLTHEAEIVRELLSRSA